MKRPHGLCRCRGSERRICEVRCPTVGRATGRSEPDGCPLVLAQKEGGMGQEEKVMISWKLGTPRPWGCVRFSVPTSCLSHDHCGGETSFLWASWRLGVSPLVKAISSKVLLENWVQFSSSSSTSWARAAGRAGSPERDQK